MTLGDYAESVIDAAASIDGPVIAVGHSMGGMVISEAAARASDAFQALAYLAAFLPRDGERLVLLANKDKHSQLAGAIKPHIFKGSTSLVLDRLDVAFFNDCSTEEGAKGKALLQENPVRPFLARVHLNDQFELLSKHYIRCLADQAITPPHQEWKASRYQLNSMQDIDCGHMANFTAPRLVAAALAHVVAF